MESFFDAYCMCSYCYSTSRFIGLLNYGVLVLSCSLIISVNYKAILYCVRSLTHRAHAPEGYGTWSVCVYLSVRHHKSCHYVQLSVQPKVPTALALSGKHFKLAFSLKMLCLKVMESFTYLAASDPFMASHQEVPTVA